LVGQPASTALFETAAAAAATDARPLSNNGFKPHMLRRAITRALVDITGIS
jgi:xanthine dehydrogenase YagS FAD-binding subunit